jgi:transcription elongation factor Elf1
MTKEASDPNEIRESDIVFECPFCEKSLAIDCRGAGLTISCPDCGNKIQVPIPEGMELFDLDSSDQDQEIRIIHMREVIAASQNRILELEADLKDLRSRRDVLEQLRAENAVRFEVITKEVETMQRSLQRIGDVLVSATESIRRTAVPSNP